MAFRPRSGPFTSIVRVARATGVRAQSVSKSAPVCFFVGGTTTPRGTVGERYGKPRLATTERTRCEPPRTASTARSTRSFRLT